MVTSNDQSGVSMDMLHARGLRRCYVLTVTERASGSKPWLPREDRVHAMASRYSSRTYRIWKPLSALGNSIVTLRAVFFLSSGVRFIDKNVLLSSQVCGRCEARSSADRCRECDEALLYIWYLLVTLVVLYGIRIVFVAWGRLSLVAPQEALLNRSVPVPSLDEIFSMILNLPFAYWEWVQRSWVETPSHVILEFFLIGYILNILLFKRMYDPEKRGYGARDPPSATLSKKEQEELLDDWEPEPLIPTTSRGRFRQETDEPQELNPVVIAETIGDGTEVRIQGNECAVLNMASANFLGLAGSKETKECAHAVLDEYTCGSCGPRGFYGTTAMHLELEDTIAEVMGTEESITYSDPIATVVSVIAAFSKRGDLIVMDDGVSHTVLTGCRLSRAKVLVFRHNDMDDLERVLQSVRDEDRKGKDQSLSQRRFIVVEGMFYNNGDVCPLPDLVRLREQYKFRLLVDDSLGFGTLGRTGKGVLEHFNIPIRSVDVLTGSLSTTLGSIGGFCVGSREVVDHQRLSGAGYCFSASLPPFLCAVATTSLRRMQAEPKLLTSLHDNVRFLRSQFADTTDVRLVSGERSPLLHLRLGWHPPDGDAVSARRRGVPQGKEAPDRLDGASHLVARARTAEEDDLDRVVSACLQRGVLVTRSHYLISDAVAPPPTLKLHVTAAMSQAQLRKAAEAVLAAVAEVRSEGVPAGSDGALRSNPAAGQQSVGRGRVRRRD